LENYKKYKDEVEMVFIQEFGKIGEVEVELETGTPESARQ
jgi:hypothetical protein